jgi:hypothetical protein
MNLSRVVTRNIRALYCLVLTEEAPDGGCQGFFHRFLACSRNSYMAEDNWESRDLCKHPRVEIDAWGQRLRGCIQCNQWMNFDGEWQRLPERDIAALRGLDWRRRNSLESG